MLAGAGDHLSLLHALELRDGELAQVLLLLDLDHGDARRRRARSSGLTALHVLAAGRRALLARRANFRPAAAPVGHRFEQLAILTSVLYMIT